MSEKSHKSWFWPALAWCFGVLAMTGIWLSVSAWLNAPCLWMAIIAVLDIALVLRFTGIDAGWPRLAGILSGTAIIILASQWLIAANAFALMLGLLPLDAARMIGPVLVSEFSRLRITRTELIYPALAIVLALYLGMHRRK